MKTTILVTSFFTLIGFSLSAQVELTNMSISETNAKYVYMGKKNLLYLNNADPSKNYEVKMNDVALPKIDLAQFTYHSPFAKENTFEIYENDVLVKKEVFPGKRVGDSEITIGNISGKTANIDEVLESPSFVIHSYDTYIEDEYVAGFKMNIIGENGQLKRSFDVVKGGDFTPEQIEMIATLQTGDKIEISELVYTDSEQISRKKPTFSISIL